MKVLLLCEADDDQYLYPLGQLRVLQDVFKGEQDTIQIRNLQHWGTSDGYLQLWREKLQSMDLSVYDYVIGSGEFFFTRLFGDKDKVRSVFPNTKTIEFNNTPKVPLSTDYVFFHMEGPNQPTQFYVGPSIPTQHLYVNEEREPGITVFVDHAMRNRNDCTVSILSYLERMTRIYPITVYHQNNLEITKNIFAPQVPAHELDAYRESTFSEYGFKTTYRCYSLPELHSYYRKADICFATHRETMGSICAEIGMCGGITMVQPGMIPDAITSKCPTIWYNQLEQINWPALIDSFTPEARQQRRQFTARTYSLESYRNTILKILESIKK